jgi:hypothetical protein
VSKILLPPFSLQRVARAISIVAGAHAAAGLGISSEPCLEVNQSTVQPGRTSRTGKQKTKTRLGKFLYTAFFAALYTAPHTSDVKLNLFRFHHLKFVKISKSFQVKFIQISNFKILSRF